MMDPEKFGRQLAVSTIRWIVGWPINFAFFLVMARAFHVDYSLGIIALVSTMCLINSTVTEWLTAAQPRENVIGTRR